MYSFFVGIDISKSFFHAAFLKEKEVINLGKFSNDHAGFKILLQHLEQEGSRVKNEWFICFENTGSYSKPLLNWLISQQITCREENALLISRSMGLRRGKDDIIDARDICLYAFRHRDTLQPTILTKPGIARLKKLLSRRSFLIRHRHACKVTLRDQKVEMDPDMYHIIHAQNEHLVHVFDQQILDIDQLIQQTIDENPSLRTNDQLAQSVKGIGPITSAFLIAYTHNYERFYNARKFACYSGIAPFPNCSGTSLNGKTRVSHLANKQLKALLSNGANAAIIHDQELKAYYARKRAEGKEFGPVINAVKNKLIQRVFAVIKRQTPYVTLMSYK